MSLPTWIQLAVLVVLVMTLMLGYSEFRYYRLMDTISDYRKQIQALDRETEELYRETGTTAERLAWLRGYASCEQDVFRAWLNQTTPATEPRSTFAMPIPEAQE